MEPFIGTEAMAAGIVTRHELATRFNAVYRDVYSPRGQVLTAAQKAHAAWLWSGRRATAVAVSAAAHSRSFASTPAYRPQDSSPWMSRSFSTGIAERGASCNFATS